MSSPVLLNALASTIGYETLLDAMRISLSLLPLSLCTAAQRRTMELFVLQGLDVIPRTAGLRHLVPTEEDLVVKIERCMNPSGSYRRHFGPAFCDAVLRKWRSNAVSNVLRSRGVLQTAIAKSERGNAEFRARERADIAKHGLRDCALPSCFKTEKTVKEFAGCSGCRSVVYCCLEHQALDWRAHKKACREKEAEHLAAEEAEEEGAGNKEAEAEDESAQAAREAEIARTLWLD